MMVRMACGSRIRRICRWRGARRIRLTQVEFDLLLFLAEHPHRMFSWVQPLTAVWGHAHTGLRTVDVHIQRLRQKLSERVPLVKTVRGIGYRLRLFLVRL
jgi:two-component system, OmpR family, response regulator MtrA